MTKRKFLPLLLLSAVVLLVLAACGGASTPEAAATEEPAAEAPAEAEAEAEPEAAEDAAAGETADEADTDAAPDDADETETAADSEAGEDDAASDDGELTGTRTFVVTPGETTASYVVDEEFLAQALDKLGIEAGRTIVIGSTNNVEGELTIDLDNKSVGDNQFVVDMTSLTTDQNRRDRWIRENGPRFADFPEATFVATGVENAPESYVEGEEVAFQLVGDLTVRDVTVPVTFDVTAAIEGDTLTGTAEADLLMSAFGIEPPNFAQTLTVADPFVVRMELVAQAQ